MGGFRFRESSQFSLQAYAVVDDHPSVPTVGSRICRVLQVRMSGYALWLSCTGYPSAER